VIQALATLQRASTCVTRCSRRLRATRWSNFWRRSSALWGPSSGTSRSSSLEPGMPSASTCTWTSSRTWGASIASCRGSFTTSSKYSSRFARRTKCTPTCDSRAWPSNALFSTQDRPTLARLGLCAKG